MRIVKPPSPFAALTGALVLTAGVFLGVRMVQENQEVREKAEELKEKTTTLCHKNESDNSGWHGILVPEKSKSLHLAHGDIDGNCPGGGNNPSINIFVDNQVVAAKEVQVETKYAYDTVELNFRIKFQGPLENYPTKYVRVILQGRENEIRVYNKVEVKADARGVYRGVITDIKPGAYDVLIKGNGYLQVKFANLSLTLAKNSYNWSSYPLLAGDFDNDNVLKANDISIFLSYYTGDINPVTEDTKVFDINMNNNIDINDLEVVLENYKELNVYGEN